MAGNVTTYPVSAANNAIQLARARKNSPGSITKGQVVYCVGYDAANEVYLVELAKADSQSTMPSVGIAYDAFTNSVVGGIVLSGDLPGVDTSSFSVNQELYVSAATAGALTSTKPTTQFVEKLAIVIRSHATEGVLQVYNYGTMEIPTDYRTYGASEGESSTSNTTYVQKLSLSTGDVPAGTYRVAWYAEQTSAKVSVAVKFRVQVDDTTTLTEQERALSAANTYYPVQGFISIALTAGTHTIDIDYCTNPGSGAGTSIKCARLEFWKMS